MNYEPLRSEPPAREVKLEGLPSSVVVTASTSTVDASLSARLSASCRRTTVPAWAHIRQPSPCHHDRYRVHGTATQADRDTGIVLGPNVLGELNDLIIRIVRIRTEDRRGTGIHSS